MHQDHAEKIHKGSTETLPAQDSIDNADSVKTLLPENHTNTNNPVDIEAAMDGEMAEDPSSYGEKASLPAQNMADSNIVDWDGPDDPENPLNWSVGLRVAHIAFASSSCLMVNLASTMYAPATELVMEDFKITSATLGSFTVTMYLLGFALGPMVVAPLSELYGRRVIYHISGLVFILCNIGCGFSKNVAMLFIFRILAGCAGSAPQTVGGGTIADVVLLERRGAAMAIFSLGPLFGPVIGPIAGAFESSSLGWRWIFYTLAIAMGVVTLASMIFMRETYPVAILNNKAKRLRKETGNMDLRSKYDLGITPTALITRSVVRPMKMLIFSPIVLLLSTYMAFVIALTFLFFTTFPEIFTIQYGFSSKIIGLVYLGMGVGQLCSLVIFGIFSDKIQQRLVAKHGVRPENRLPLMIVFSPLVVVGLLWYGWSAQAKTHWIVPIIGTGVAGFGAFFVIMPIMSYLIDTYTEYAASALAANTLIRSLLSCFLPLAAPALYADLGYGWGNSLLALITLLFLPVPWLFYKYGEKLRTRYKLEL